ncbi:ABC transporter permease [Anaerosacchariphilus polymeriproducens]|uniref:ABC transporter permease n=1 Tax=Anaerosacchariphilus polymeriproducens TaxID=1812858 RepID=A0A371AWE8_9FIRM|nr:ABC transporter permease [Anaerosacchariphilus polymeriproducens]RDU23906.1 ABC transporter permease [Anaerosacchariphilus polymeriproducens]
MLFRCIQVEQKKLRKSYLWFVFLLIPCIPAIMGTFNYLQSLETLKSEWYSLWTQHTLFYSSFFYAPLIAVYCSYLWRLEHLNQNWNFVMTVPVPRFCLFLAKFSMVFFMTILTQIWVGILFYMSGKFAGLSGTVPIEIWTWILRGSIAGTVIILLQLYLSMIIRSFSVPVVISLIGSIVGLVINSMGIGFAWPYSLLLIGMNANRENEMLGNRNYIFILSCLIFCVMIIGISMFRLKKKDIKTS